MEWFSHKSTDGTPFHKSHHLIWSSFPSALGLYPGGNGREAPPGEREVFCPLYFFLSRETTQQATASATTAPIPLRRPITIFESPPCTQPGFDLHPPRSRGRMLIGTVSILALSQLSSGYAYEAGGVLSRGFNIATNSALLWLALAVLW
jgi:hypothetical protein